MASNVVYFDPDNDPHGLICLNKPWGLPLKSDEGSKLSLSDALPLLQECLNLKETPTVIKTVER